MGKSTGYEHAFHTIDQYTTLTIRQELAKSFTAAMITGIVSGSGKDAHGWSDKDFVKSGFSLADAFIEELNKEV